MDDAINKIYLILNRDLYFVFLSPFDSHDVHRPKNVPNPLRRGETTIGFFAVSTAKKQGAKTDPVFAPVQLVGAVRRFRLRTCPASPRKRFASWKVQEDSFWHGDFVMAKYAKACGDFPWLRSFHCVIGTMKVHGRGQVRRMSQAPFEAVKRAVEGADPYRSYPRFRQSRQRCHRHLQASTIGGGGTRSVTEGVRLIHFAPWKDFGIASRKAYGQTIVLQKVHFGAMTTPLLQNAPEPVAFSKAFPGEEIREKRKAAIRVAICRKKYREGHNV